MLTSRRTAILTASASVGVGVFNIRRAYAASISGSPAGWSVSLSHNDVNNIANGAAGAALVAPPPYSDFLEAGSSYLQTMDTIGGHNGVNVTGIGLTMVATPAGIPVVSDAIAFLTSVAGSVFNGALGAFKSIGGLVAGHGADRGELHADEDGPKSEEKFLIVGISGGKVALASYSGYFSADHSRGGRVWADRQAIGPWERWTLVSHNSGLKVSFVSDTNNPITADPSTDHCQLWTNRTAIGPWEIFDLAPQPDGSFGLHANSNGKWVSSAPG